MSPTKALRKVSRIDKHTAITQDLPLTSVCTQGKWEKIGGVDCYVGTPTREYPKDKTILYLSDVFGPQLINAQARIALCVNSVALDSDFMLHIAFG